MFGVEQMCTTLPHSSGHSLPWGHPRTSCGNQQTTHGHDEKQNTSLQHVVEKILVGDTHTGEHGDTVSRLVKSKKPYPQVNFGYRR